MRVQRLSALIDVLNNHGLAGDIPRRGSDGPDRSGSHRQPQRSLCSPQRRSSCCSPHQTPTSAGSLCRTLRKPVVRATRIVTTLSSKTNAGSKRVGSTSVGRFHAGSGGSERGGPNREACARPCATQWLAPHRPCTLSSRVPASRAPTSPTVSERGWLVPLGCGVWV